MMRLLPLWIGLLLLSVLGGVALRAQQDGDTDDTKRHASGSLAYGKTITASCVVGDEVDKHGPHRVVDDDPQTYWACDEDVHQAWLDIDLGEVMAINRVMIDEARPWRIRSYDLQYKGPQGVWRTILAGDVVGRRFARTFRPVRARYVRFNILQSTKGPAISELHLFGP